MPAAYIIAISATATEAYSARPDAPVVPHHERAPRAHPVRLAMSRALYRAAGAVAPAEPHPTC